MKLAAIVFSLALTFSASSISAQTTSVPAQMSAPTLPNHGLVLTITQASTPDPVGPVEIRRCLGKHAPLACVGFTYTLDNNGNETILYPWVSCPPSSPAVEYRGSDGTWKPFPVRLDIGLSCTATVGGLGLIHPGRGSPFWQRLAYMFSADGVPLDTSLPTPGTTAPGAPPTGAEGLVLATNGGYALLARPGRFVIRLRKEVWGCITKQPISEKDVPVPPSDDGSRLCVGSSFPGKPLAVLVSNELELTAPPTPQ